MNQSVFWLLSCLGLTFTLLKCRVVAVLPSYTGKHGKIRSIRPQVREQKTSRQKLSEQFPAEGWHIWHGECTALEDKGVVNAQLNVNCLCFLKKSHILGARWEPPKKCQRAVWKS